MEIKLVHYALGVGAIVAAIMLATFFLYKDPSAPPAGTRARAAYDKCRMTGAEPLQGCIAVELMKR